MLEEERITEQASDVVEDPWGVAETVAENFKVSTLAVGVRLKAIGLISDADSEGVRVEVIGSGNLGGKNGRRRKESRLRFRDPDSGYFCTIVRALEDERVGWLDASYLPDEKTPMAQRMIDEYYRIEVQ